MWLASLRQMLARKSRSSSLRLPRPTQWRIIPCLEYLEDRVVPTTQLNAASVSDLIAEIGQANASSSSSNPYVITLTGTSPYAVNVTDLTTGAFDALPVITAANLTINGQGATIDGSFGGRILNVGAGAGVTLENLTLTHGLASGANAQGGAIYDAGNNLTLNNVTVAINAASAAGQTSSGSGNSAQGGGLYISGGTVHLTNSTFLSNSASGASGGVGGRGGDAQGGGIYANAATLTISGGSVSKATINAGSGGAGAGATLTTAAGAGGAGGNSEGGGVFALNSTVTLENGVVLNNNTLNRRGGAGGTGGARTAINPGGQGGQGGAALGGGLYVEGGSVTIEGDSTALDANSVHGGHGGNGADGGNGGSGGEADGGGLYALNAPVTFTGNSSLITIDTNTPTDLQPGINKNSTFGGTGGLGGASSKGAGGTGGGGGNAQGGGVFVSSSGLTLTLGDAAHAPSINLNTATAGNGGSGSAGLANLVAANGGAGGEADGGGLAIRGAKLASDNATLFGNTAMGGKGGIGALSALGALLGNYGVGGSALGGGLFVSGSSQATVLNSVLFNNTAQGAGDSANNTGGGNALGGAVYGNASTLNVLNSTIADNLLKAGTAQQSSTQGKAQGGGLYAANGTLSLTNDTVVWNDLNAISADTLNSHGGGVYNGSGNTLNLENTILALNQLFAATTSSGTYDNLASIDPTLVATNDSNLLGAGLDANQTDANLAPGGSQQLFVGPATTTTLGYQGQIPTNNNGGLTYSLPVAWTSSPAISNGDIGAASAIAGAEGVSADNAVDQRGMKRVVDNTIDIGATQTQLLLNNTTSVTTVQTGGTITYTLTVHNKEATAAAVSLSDVMPAYTTYQAGSAAGAGWTITQPSGTNNNTLSASATVAANGTATLTFTVTVASSVPGNTITNTASIVPTGNTAAGTRSVAASTQVQGTTTTDITSKVGTYRSPILHVGSRTATTYNQAVLLSNNSGATLTGPIALVLVGLPSDVTLLNATGTYNGSPYIDIVPANGSWQAGWWHFMLTILQFQTNNRADITYTPQIMQGI